MPLALSFKTDNAAFKESDGEETEEARLAECARILREIAEKMDNGKDHGLIIDANGNTIGSFDLI